MNASYTAEGHPEFLTEIAALQSQFELFRFLRRTVELFGFKAFLVLRLPATTSLELSENSIITNWPAEFLGAYDRMGLLKDSPLMAQLRRSVVPFDFQFDLINRQRGGDKGERAGALFSEFGFRCGVCIPLHDSHGGRAAMIIAGDRQPLIHIEMIELTTIAVHAYQRLTEVTGAFARQEQPLTDRELDCLTWTAAGKTSADIAAILSLSEHTVNHYLNRAVKKLDTVNRTQAVAKALRRGLIT